MNDHKTYQKDHNGIMRTKIQYSSRSLLQNVNSAFFLIMFFFCLAHADNLSEKLSTIKLPSGFHIDIYAHDIEGARSLAIGQHGTIFVGSRSEGKVYALQDINGDFRADKRFIIASGLNTPNGVAFYNGALYVAEINRILRFDNIESRLSNPPRPIVVNDTFPKDTHHGWKFIRFGPDGYLYIPVGAPCNTCDPSDQRYGSIMRMRPDGTGLEIFARGIRNSVGFDWHPKNHVLFFTDNGRDWMGNNIPPDELNMAQKKGMHFGFPYCYGNDLADSEFSKGKNCNNFTKPIRELGPHVAPLGMRFYTGKQFPKKYINQIFIAEHGSWNRIPPIGYRISLVSFTQGHPPSYDVFAQGWLDGFISWGRPVDLMVMPDGSLLVSDDKANAIYRIWYRNKK
ncbi:MAG: sorbosone dehydrogenase family protein [Sulfurovaceae bacterium]|nr:sorbosone dehydrogenase family protein [Sulfurovaceae bacterium]